MAYVLDKVSEDTFYENLLLGITKLLERNRQIKNVHLHREPACTTCEVSVWEHIYSLRLPEDLKSFFLATNGLNLTWDYVVTDAEVLPMGRVHITTLIEFIPFTGYRLHAVPELKLCKKIFSLQLGAESKVFQLTTVDDVTRVCLVYMTPRHSPKIWLVNGDFKWYFLADNFTKYFLMLLRHLGMPLWQYCFTPEGVPPWAEQIMIMSAPHIEIGKPIEYEPDRNKPKAKVINKKYMNKLDPNVFKPRVRACAKTTDLLRHRRKR